MTTPRMGAQYIEEATYRRSLVEAAFGSGRWATVVREAQECVELFLKGALRLAAVEPARVHDVGDMLRQEAQRFPPWFTAEVERLAAISTRMTEDRGAAFYGDENAELGPQQLFNESDAEEARRELTTVATACERLAAEFRARGSSP